MYAERTFILAAVVSQTRGQHSDGSQFPALPLPRMPPPPLSPRPIPFLSRVEPTRSILSAAQFDELLDVVNLLGHLGIGFLSGVVSGLVGEWAKGLACRFVLLGNSARRGLQFWRIVGVVRVQGLCVGTT